MKTTITIKSNVCSINLGGIGITIDTRNIVESIATLEKFYDSVIPAKRKDEMKGSIVQEIFEASRKYRPFVQDFMDCFDSTGDSESTMIVHENGMITFEGSQDGKASGSINIKKMFQLFSDISDFVEAEQDARSKKREEAEAKADAEHDDLYDRNAEAEAAEDDRIREEYDASIREEAQAIRRQWDADRKAAKKSQATFQEKLNGSVIAVRNINEEETE